MSTLATIDPGKVTGWAVFWRSELIDTGIIQREKLLAELLRIVARHGPGKAIIELPQIYPVSKWKGDPNDLIQVAYLAGQASAVLAETAIVETVKPYEWKGQRPKALDIQYTMSLLSLEEKAVVMRMPRRADIHNALDAVGIGLWKLARR